MPVFHTKTIESILDPVAQQVSRLVIIHEEGEEGQEMPDLVRPVQAVSKAVDNLVKTGRDFLERLEQNTQVGHEMSSNTDDIILKQDMPAALHKVEGAAKLLEEAALLSQADPYSKQARSKLIEGSRWILQGTSNVLLVFDESEVRKIIGECKKVLDYLSVAEVIEGIDDLVQFVKDLSPCLSKVTKDVSRRTEDLTHQIHREILSRSVEQLKTLAPILICSMKIFIQIIHQGGKGVEEAAENRNYLSARMIEEVNEIIRVLQLTTYDEDEWDSDNLTVMKKTQGLMDSCVQNALDWLKDPAALHGGVGERSLRRLMDHALRIADRSLPLDAEHVRKLTGDIQSMVDALCELRAKGEGTTPQAQTLAQGIENRLNELNTTVQQAINRVEKSGIQQPAPTVSGRLEQARRWLEQPGVDDRGLGLQAIALVVEEGSKIAEVLPPSHKDHVATLCRHIDRDARALTELCHAGQADSPAGIQLSRNVASNLNQLKDAIRSALVDRVVQDFVDIGSPLKHFTEAVIKPNPDDEIRDKTFNEKADDLAQYSEKAVRTAKMVAVGSNTGNKKVAEAILAYSAQVDSLTPQLINAGRIRMVYPDNKAAEEHFQNLQQQYGNALAQVRAHCDDATDSLAFIQASVAAIEERAASNEDAVRAKNALKLVENTSVLARLTNRLLQVAKQEAENSEEPAYSKQVYLASEKLQQCLAPVVQAAKSVALNIEDEQAIGKWRQLQTELLDSVQGVESSVANHPSDERPPLPPYPQIGDLSLSEEKNSPAAMPAANSEPAAPAVAVAAPPPPQFTDEELSEIFQINFSEIFGSSLVDPISTTPAASSYKGIKTPSRKKNYDHQDAAPPRPPLPSSEPHYPDTTTTDDESEDLFQHAPTPSQGPIMMAAHDLHQEVKQWSSKDNDIIAAAKKMAMLMAKLSQLVASDSGSKKKLIDCARAIAESSEEVTRIAKELAKECTDRRMRTGLLQVCERIPTIATQLKILSTVKATMLGAQGTEEDQEATDMLIGNAQNLMQSVKQTVTAAEAASIKIRTDAGIRLKWIRKQPWYQY